MWQELIKVYRKKMKIEIILKGITKYLNKTSEQTLRKLKEERLEKTKFQLYI